MKLYYIQVHLVDFFQLFVVMLSVVMVMYVEQHLMKNLMLYTKWLILLEETVKFRGSKYVQSNLGDIFTENKKET